MSTENFLVEIGTEELPPKALLTLSNAFSKAILAGVKDSKLSFGEAKSYATPRRLALFIADLQVQGEDQAVEVFGPPADRARDDEGNWTPAAQGFARKNGVNPEELEIAETEKGARLAYRSTSAGIRAADILPELVADSLHKLPIPKRMRWGAGRTEFVRPVHWILALLGSDVLDCTILGRQSGRLTRGHRFHSSGEIEIRAAQDYSAALAAAHVVADFSQRRDIIRGQVIEQAKKVNCTAVISDDLLDEVTALVEWPVALTGTFEERFLQVPAEALVSSMKEHQKYFHLVDDSGALQPFFITVSNIESKDATQIIDGNERVIRPRLSDADFFFSSDKKTTLASRVERLKSIVFQQKLGTLFDKTSRLIQLSGELAAGTGADKDQAQRAAELSKTDLITLMVGEFADMQGIAGRYYALNDGEAEAVADALQQQYWPRFAGDVLPNNPIATTLALADRLDTIVGIFGIGQPPSGSSDPFALRRASLGVLRVLVEGQLDLDLREALELTAAQYPADILLEDTVEQVMAYMVERFRAWYEDESIATEVFNAVAAKALTVPLDIHHRVHAVHAFSQLPQAAALAAANKRVSNILSKQELILGEPGVSKDLLTDAAEKTLADQVAAKTDLTAGLLAQGQYEQILSSLADLQDPVDAFFDQVMVMADDPALQNNRLNLLRQLRDLFLQVADISQLVVSR